MAESIEATSDPTMPTQPADLAKLAELTAAANLQYSLKNYAAAADIYSDATQLQAQLKGELALENAELLYLYGRCLYHVAVAKSDVLGGKVAGEKKEKKSSKANGEGSSSTALPDAEQKLAEEVVEAAVESKEGVKQEELKPENKPYFQFTGDENWDTESEDEEGGGAEDAEDDDFADAYEVLEVARLLSTKQLDALKVESQNDNSEGFLAQKPEARSLMERLADIHDLQAEISLENERFADAIPDFRSSLEMKTALHSTESSLIAEAHFKLSLALEFASMTAIREAQNVGGDALSAATNPVVDQDMRDEAAKHMEAAIESCRLRVEKEEAELAGLDEAKAAEKRKSINDVKEMIDDMVQRLTDLRSPPQKVDISGITGPAGVPDGSNPLSGLLGSILGETPAQQKARIEEATSKANDLSGLVRHKKKPKIEPSAAPVVNGKGKRKADDDAADTDGEESERKKSRVDEAGAS